MIGTPMLHNATRMMLLGSGELGKEFAIEAMRLGIEVIAVDNYQFAPAMQVAQKSYVTDMKNGKLLRELAYTEKPDFIVPEIEAIDTEALLNLEREGFKIVPCAKAVLYTMNRIRIRQLTSERLGLRTSNYRFASSLNELKKAIDKIGFPAVVKPVMSSSGKGQSIIKSEEDIEKAWSFAQENARGKGNEVIVEEFINFDFEITLLTARTPHGTYFCEPIGHLQVMGDYRESWQPQPMTRNALRKAREMARRITDELGGYGIFGCEFFVKGDDVWFSELSPRPHDTGMVTMVTQNINEFEIHLRAILGLPMNIKLLSPGASCCFHSKDFGVAPVYENIEKALGVPDTKLRIFGKPTTRPNRRMGIALSTADNIEEAKERARKAASMIRVSLGN